MSTNNNNNDFSDDIQPARQTNRIRGPTSALSSFLREHGIRVENRSRRIMRQQEALRQQNDNPQQAENRTAGDNSTVSNPSSVRENSTQQNATSILYTPESSTRAQALETTGKRKKGEDDDQASDDDSMPGPSTRRSQPGRTRILFCIKCKSRFASSTTSVADDSENSKTCPSCLAGKPVQKPKKAAAAKKRRIQGSTSVDGGQVPMLQDICIDIVARYIDDVEALGEISFQSMDKLAKIICRNRKLTNQTARLFLEPRVIDLNLYDCTNLDETGLMNVADFCPYLKDLRLVYCGRMTSKVIESYATRLRELRSIDLSGPFLVSEQAWISFAETVGKSLEGFKLSYTARFNEECLSALVEHCPDLRSLKLTGIGGITIDWFSFISKLNNLKSLELEWPPEKRGATAASLVELLSNVGKGLTELSLIGFSDIDGDALAQGILDFCPNLTRLNIASCSGVSSEAIQKLFREWKTQREGYGLQSLNISRCLELDDEALKAILLHSHKTLEHLNIHSLDNITSAGLELLAGKGEGMEGKHCGALQTLDCGFVRSMDDFVLRTLIDSCPSLKHVLVWGCHQLTHHVQLRPGLRVEGREQS